MNYYVREAARHAFTALIYGIVITALLIVATFALGNQQSVAVKYQKAIACELAVPITTEGRDPALVSVCFTDQGLPAPSFVTG